MDKQFVPYELAVKLKELGFNEECFGYYNAKGSIRYSGQIEPLGLDTEEMSNDILNSKYCSAPLWQQAFDWFSIHHKISNSVMRVPDGMWVFDVFREDYSDAWECYYKSQEEARLACLEKLIELTK